MFATTLYYILPICYIIIIYRYFILVVIIIIIIINITLLCRLIRIWFLDPDLSDHKVNFRIQFIFPLVQLLSSSSSSLQCVIDVVEVTPQALVKKVMQNSSLFFLSKIALAFESGPTAV